MSSPCLKSCLLSISSSLSSESSLLQLQELLTSPVASYEILSSPPLRKVLLSICNSLKSSLLSSCLYSLTRSFLSKAEGTILPSRKVRSVHDLTGNFLWAEKGTADLFDVPLHELYKTNLFSLISVKSRQQLALKHGEFILKQRGFTVISYSLNNKSLVLTSRCSLIMYSPAAGAVDTGILVESRVARHSKGHESKEYISPLLSPIFPSFEESPVCAKRLPSPEDFVISPFTEFKPQKKKRFEDLEISEFS